MKNIIGKTFSIYKINLAPFLLSLVLVNFVACSKTAQFQDLKIGMSEKELLISKTCENARVAYEDKAKNIKVFLCHNSKINNINAVTMTSLHDGKLIRIVVSFAECSLHDIEDLFTSLNAKYGKPTSNARSFIDTYKRMAISEKYGVAPIYPNSSWENETVQLYYNGKDLQLLYQIEKYYDFYSKLSANTKDI